MSKRRVELLVGVVLTVVALAGASWQVDVATSSAGEGSSESLPRLVCPLH